MDNDTLKAYLAKGYTRIDGDIVSPFKVMQSAAGYFIGRTYVNEEYSAEFLYSKETEYFTTEEDAKEYLQIIQLNK